MVEFSVLVELRPREGIANPEGVTLQRALAGMGYDKLQDVRVGKAIRFSVVAPDEASARAKVKELCERVLVNPVLEDASFQLHSR